MKNCLVLSVLLSGIATSFSQSTNSIATNAAPRRPQSPAVVSPEVQSDGRVIFRIRSTNDAVIKVTGDWRSGPVELRRGSNQVWSGTLGPLDPDIYGYSFNIDGVEVIDPSNPWSKPMRASRTSLVEVPGNPPRLWEFQPVPHGTVHIHNYFSKSLNRLRRLHVYTPPGYEKNRSRLPVLYLFHGSGDNDATWTVGGRAHFIADNLLARKQCQPMVIVMTDGHAYVAAPGAAATNATARNVDAFRDDLLREVMPLVESTYRIKADRAHRAIIGLSMGGGQSLRIGLERQDLFAWVGGMSSFLPDPEKAVAASFPKSKSDLRLLWIGCGKDDFLIDGARRLAAALSERNIPHEFRETAGNHSWPVWRGYLGEFLPLLFTDKRKG